MKTSNSFVLIVDILWNLRFIFLALVFFSIDSLLNKLRAFFFSSFSLIEPKRLSSTRILPIDRYFRTSFNSLRYLFFFFFFLQLICVLIVGGARQKRIADYNGLLYFFTYNKRHKIFVLNLSSKLIKCCRFLSSIDTRISRM